MGNRGVMLVLRERPHAAIEKLHERLLRLLKEGVKEERDQLTNQDLMRLARPHVTVMNKAEKEEDVQACLEEVEKVFADMKGGTGRLGQLHGKALGFELYVG